MTRKITVVVGLLLITGAIFGAKTIIDRKKPGKEKVEKVINNAFVKTVKNGPVPIKIIESGRLFAKQKMDIYAEVQGVMEATSQEFKPGSKFAKGEILLKIRNNAYYANLQAQKSVLQNLITSMMPDLRMDYPDSYGKWDAYLRDFAMDKPLSKLPDPSSEKEKFFVTGKNIYTTYYNTKNQELISAKYNIRAPYTGILTESLVHPGTVIRPGQRLGEFINTSTYELHVSVSQSLITSVMTNDSVIVKQPDNTIPTWIGKIIRINGKVDPTNQTVQVFIELKGKDLKEGMFLEAQIPGKAKENAFEIPRTLLSDKQEVFIVVDNKLKLSPVDVLYKNQNSIIVSGLPNEAQVLIRTIPGAYHGMRVNVSKQENG